jgi:hypothetical protein
MPINTIVSYSASTTSFSTQDVASARSSSPTSTISLTSKPANSTTLSTKDYFAAFGTLESTYGFAGMGAAPTPISKSAALKPKSIKKNVGSLFGGRSFDAPEPDMASKTSVPGTKDYDATFANMSSSFGLPGSGAAIPQRHWRTGAA